MNMSAGPALTNSVGEVHSRVGRGLREGLGVFVIGATVLIHLFCKE